MDFGGRDLCPKCKRLKNPLPGPFFDHKEWCNFWIFVDQVAPARGLQNLRGATAVRRICSRELDFMQFVDGKLIPALDKLQIEYVLYCLHGIWGKMYQIFIPEPIITAIEVYTLIVNSNNRWLDYQDLHTFLFKWINCPDDHNNQSSTCTTNSKLP